MSLSFLAQTVHIQLTGYTYHKINPLKGSLNAVDVANKVVDIPQIHYVGDLDRNIGLRLAESFKARSGPGACLQIRQVEERAMARGGQSYGPS